MERVLAGSAGVLAALSRDLAQRVELVRDNEGRQGWFLVEAWATT